MGAGGLEEALALLLQLFDERLLAENDPDQFGPEKLLQLPACHDSDPRWDDECKGMPGSLDVASGSKASPLA